MIELSNGMRFKKIEDLKEFIYGIRKTKQTVGAFTAEDDCFGKGVKHALSTAIAAIDAAIENARLDYKRALQKEAKMKAAKKPAAKPVAKPATKKAVKKPVVKKK